MKSIKRLLAIVFICFVCSVGTGQEDTETSMSNIQEYTPSKLLRKGQWDIKFFNSIYTQTEQTNAGSTSTSIPRQTFFTNTTEVYTGVSENSRINLGLIIQVRSNTYGGGGALEVFRFENNDTDARSGLTTSSPFHKSTAF